MRTTQQLEALQARYVGTGHADVTKHEWTSNIARDSYASYIGHPGLLSYMAVGMGECREVVRGRFIEVRVCCLIHAEGAKGEELGVDWVFMEVADART